ncbi:MAG: hypothetical protein IAI49_15495, partial [Candidatus Eremiobacteraeota bacterium]|nr:hypothetical protein [Candidatus Eremiobacteraeota bacterium]
MKATGAQVMNFKSRALTIGMLAAFLVPAAAQAQPVPSYASQEEQIRGTIASIGGKYTVYVRDRRGFVDTVQLHDGTIINPTGLTLAPGQSVTILGRSDGNRFDANEIDTPYTVDDGGYVADVAYGPDYGGYYVAPYPYYSYYPAYALSYPAFISLGFSFGGGYGGYYGHGYYGHGGYYGRGYGYPGHVTYGGSNGRFSSPGRRADLGARSYGGSVGRGASYGGGY